MTLVQILNPMGNGTKVVTARQTVIRKPAGFFAMVRLWRIRVRERQELAGLTSRELRDFGASRSEAIGEVRKPFWQQ
jgi:uncharacterized protein YjiS (DUF1127 family)